MEEEANCRLHRVLPLVIGGLHILSTPWSHSVKTMVRLSFLLSVCPGRLVQSEDTYMWLMQPVIVSRCQANLAESAVRKTAEVVRAERKYQLS
jgi:hypothetical protein